MRRITGLAVKTKYLNPERGYVPGIGVNANYFPISKPINFTIDTKAGDIEHYVIEMNGQPWKNSTLNMTSFKTSQVICQSTLCECRDLIKMKQSIYSK